MDVILTSYFTGKPDPQSGRFRPENDAALMDPWVRSLRDLELHGVICHDGPVMVTGVKVQLHHYQLKTTWSVNDERFLCWLELLQNHPEIDRVFLTDLFDVDFLRNPFDLVGSAYDLYVGCGAGFDRTIGANNWLVGKMLSAYKTVYHSDQRTVNAGVIGGRRQAVMRLLEYMVCDFVRLHSTANINMAVFNRAVYDLFPADRVLIGPPVTSRFKRYEQSGDFAVRHK